MDLMKVFDKTVREIKREVNLKVLKVPEIEQKVLDATDDEPWGPHGSAMAEIAQATKKFTECQMVMNVLWTRLTETGQNWRFVYKSLAVIEYLVAHGSERAVDDIIEHTFQISSLSSFEYVEPSGKDQGINVRKRAESIAALLNNKDKIQEVRNKAAANREKYFGLSSSGITYKSGSASLGGNSSRSSDKYGGSGDTFKDSYYDKDRFGEDKFDKSSPAKSRRGASREEKGSASKTGSSRYISKDQNGASKPATKVDDSDNYASVPSQTSRAPSNNYEEDFDDFDPRGTSASKSTAGNSNQVDLFGQSLVGDLMDAPASVPIEIPAVNSNSSEVDLFADATFVSASSNIDSGGKSESQAKVDLFASQPAPSSTVSSIDFFAASDPVFQQENKPSKSDLTNTNVVDPFAAVPLNNFDGSDLFGAFTSPTDSVSVEPTENPVGNNNNLNATSSSESKTPLKKDGFQVKSGIWADSLSRGLIDLNISAPKKVSLADIGIVGGLTDISEEKERGPPPSFSMGRAMGSGTGLGKSGFSSSTSSMDADDFFSSLSNPHHQSSGFQK